MRHQVTELEMQLLERRHLVGAVISGIRQKIATQMVSPGMLLAAVGIGVAVEQTTRHRGWLLKDVLEASNVWLALMSLAAAGGAPKGDHKGA